VSDGPFRQVGHEPPRLPWPQRLGSLGLALAASLALVALIVALWWLWLCWLRAPTPQEGPIPVILDAG
jgi:hypothetical protein